MIESGGKLLLFILGYSLIAISLIPLIRHDNWIFRIFEYPRGQKLVINVVLLGIFFLLADFHQTHDIIFCGLLFLNMLYLLYQIWPYTVISKFQLAKSPTVNISRKFKLLICNVYQNNRDVKSTLKTIREHRPDIILLVETDGWWKENLDIIAEDYPHQVARPLDNTYGMLLYSKFELIDSEVKFLIKDDVPSIHTIVKLPSGELFKLYCLHPQPPVPHETARSTERDAEILLIAKEAKSSIIPVVVAGDLNDVAWSYTTELFLKVSGLLDPRRGRGFYNTFHAKYRLLRWPLDHVFCSHHFQLHQLVRLPFMGSDHFPILIELQVGEEKAAANKQQALQAGEDEKALAEEKITKA